MSEGTVKPIDCFEAARRLWAYLDGELEPSSAAEMEQHPGAITALARRFSLAAPPRTSYAGRAAVFGSVTRHTFLTNCPISHCRAAKSRHEKFFDILQTLYRDDSAGLSIPNPFRSPRVLQDIQPRVHVAGEDQVPIDVNAPDKWEVRRWNERRDLPGRTRL